MLRGEGRKSRTSHLCGATGNCPIRRDQVNAAQAPTMRHLDQNRTVFVMTSSSTHIHRRRQKESSWRAHCSAPRGISHAGSSMHGSPRSRLTSQQVLPYLMLLLLILFDFMAAPVLGTGVDCCSGPYAPVDCTSGVDYKGQVC